MSGGICISWNRRNSSLRQTVRKSAGHGKRGKKRIEREENRKKLPGYFDGWRIHPLETFSMLAAFIVIFVLFPRPWNCLVAIVVALAEGLYVWNHLKDGKQKKKAKIRDDKEQGNTLKAAYEMQKGRLAKVQESYHEKESSMRT